MSTGTKLFTRFGGMCWPTAGEEMGQLQHTLRYGNPSRSEILCAAAVIAAYMQMIHDPQTKRQMVVRNVRAASTPREERLP